MTLFWVLGALLAAAALALVARPLWRRRAAGGVSRDAMNAAVYRDQVRELDADLASGALAQADFERARQEIERRVLEDFSHVEKIREAGGNRFVAYSVLAIPLLALGIYFLVGNPAVISVEETAHATDRQIDAMVERLAAKLKDNPDDGEGWKLLGRSYAALGRFPEAAEAYAKAAARAPRDADVLVDLADVLAMANGQRLEGDPEKLIERALEIDPNNLKGLALSGTAAFSRGDFAGAAARWERMLPLVPAQSEDARIIRDNVAEAKAKGGADSKPASRAAKLAGSVSLSPKLKGRASPDDSVFIFARAVEGPRVPLAVLRMKVRDLPASFSLDDSMAMAPGARLSGFARVVVGARISKSGTATPQPGDLQGSSAAVANDAAGVKVVIDAVVGEK
jgi:cytochrome c-type biogenesis protein CcmH